jgi:hypothetical protein
MGNVHFVLVQEFNEIAPVYPVMTFRQPESGQPLLLNPIQHSNCGHAAMPGNETGSDISGTPGLFAFLQVIFRMSIL